MYNALFHKIPSISKALHQYYDSSTLYSLLGVRALLENLCKYMSTLNDLRLSLQVCLTRV